MPDPITTTATATTNAGAEAMTSAIHNPLSIRIIGIGGAGGNAVSHMADSDLLAFRPVALHTSARILEMTRAPEKMLLGADLIHGLGAGGDPSLARAAAERDLSLLKSLCQDLDLLFIVVGLGGGTGTGVAPVLARVAKEAGALVLAVATLPFELEGPRRRRQAENGLAELKAAVDAVICLGNQKIFRIVDENTSVLESLKITNELLAQGIRGICQMLTRPGLIHVDFADLRAALLDRHVESYFATAEAKGDGRAREITEQLLACPLLEGGQVLSESDAVLVNLVGGPDLSMADVKRVMEEINRRTDDAQVVMGASIAEGYQGRLSLTLVASRRTGNERPDIPHVDRLSAAPRAPTSGLDNGGSAPLPAGLDNGNSRNSAPGPALAFDTPESLGSRHTDTRSGCSVPSSRRFQQAQLPLEIVSKGRFEKSHPTIHRGEDLDIPTYVRRGIPLN